VRRYPTWHNTRTGKILEGYHTPEQIMQKLTVRVRRPVRSVEEINEKLAELRKRFPKFWNRFGTDLLTASPIQLAPQPDYLTNYCGTGENGGFRGGNALSPQQNLIGGLQAELNRYSNAGPFLGMNFGTPSVFQPDFGGPNPPTGLNVQINTGGPRLPQPYGPSDNALMKQAHWAGSLLPPVDLSLIGQFGRGLSRRRRKRSLARKAGRRSLLKRKFGATPGTPGWPSRPPSIGSEYVSPRLVAAKGYNLSPVLGFPLYPRANQELQNASTKYSINMPMQFSNNHLNNPQPRATKFGASRPSLYYMEGPNNVGYQANMPLYNGRNSFGGILTLANGGTNSGAGSLWGGAKRGYKFGAGANTVNWLTGETYRPAQSRSITKVQPDPANPRAWLSGTKGLDYESSLPNGARRFTELGMKGNHFGAESLMYNIPNFSGMQAGPVIVEQPLPPRMQLSTQIPEGSYVSYGKRSPLRRRSVHKPVHKPPVHRKKPLRTNFGGKTITLSPTNKLTIE